MGLLDDLKKESDKLRQIEQTEAERRAALEKIYEEVLLPKMQYLLGYLYELVQHLNYVNPEVIVNVYSNEVPELSELKQSEYRIVTERSQDVDHFSLRFYCERHGYYEFETAGQTNIEREVQTLLARGLKHDCKRVAGQDNSAQRAFFRVQRRVPVVFDFATDIETSTIKIAIRNFENLDIRVYHFEPDSINDELLDILARYILREETDFLKVDISDEQRTAIRQQLQSAMQQREHEIAEAERHERQEQEKEKGKRTFLKSIRTLVRKESSDNHDQ